MGGLIEIGGLFETGFFKFNLAKTVVNLVPRAFLKGKALGTRLRQWYQFSLKN